MKRLFLSLVLLFSCSAIVSAQTTATNFTATDCNGNSHTLFNKLDSGKVVVLVWVMPCSMCISDANAAYNAVQAFATSHPGKVLFYLADDVGNTSCSALAGWATANGIGTTNRTLFGNAGNTINENNYGGNGMPHVTVIGGTSRTIYFNQRNGSNNGQAIQNAIQQALAATSIAEPNGSAEGVSVYPNPASDRISVNYTLAKAGDVRMEVLSVSGSVVKVLTQRLNAGSQSANIELGEALSPGYYTLKLYSDGSSKAVVFTVTR